MRDFWQALPRPFFALAPLDDVTDAAFRRLIAGYGKPHVMFTEFTSADGLALADAEGQRKLRRKLLYSEAERPIVAQLFTSVPEHMEKGAQLLAELGFDGVDINMGCPDRAVEKSGCGAALIKHPARARELIRAAKRAGLPVSVKTRIGYNADELDRWLSELIAEEPAAVTLHARTRKEMSDVPAHWDAVARAVALRDSAGSATLIVGNGDVEDIADAAHKAARTGCDGVMLGRAIFGTPWLFTKNTERTPEEKMNALAEHIEIFDDLLGDLSSYATMKKHFKAYLSGWPGARELRARMMDTHCAADALSVLRAESV